MDVLLFLSYVCHAFASVHCCLVVTCSLVMFNCVFVTSSCGILGQVWYMIESIPDLCLLSYHTPAKFKGAMSKG